MIWSLSGSATTVLRPGYLRRYRNDARGELVSGSNGSTYAWSGVCLYVLDHDDLLALMVDDDVPDGQFV